ncbi:hypothetical protein CI109_102324 [Kwoniella shandongensis]|uniref:Mannosyltransferase n=1 Tax=Kwoniella shandongensis TaxID=1734106 RepID=A0A5M6C4P8_9TREE|nr:uncharacterized protein CI109_003356 [Kwoniella shandongensis]KAA5528455.1 hypothetical protein CI109_003356 [Kwoniella shandongensis]
MRKGKGGPRKSQSPAVVRRKLLNALPNVLPFIVTITHVLLSPYTKVEESFTLHAVHDVLAYGFGKDTLQLWDHITFPGAVPRSFLPPIILGLVAYPFAALSVFLGIIKTKLDVQLLIRIVLAAIFSISFNHLAKSIRARYGALVRIWFTILSLTSFHIPYYAGRTLPNFMALPGVLLSMSYLIRAKSSSPESITTKRLRNAIVLLTALATVVRLELALFVLPVVLSLVLSGQITVGQAIRWGMVGGFGSLAISSPIDLTLWRPTIPHPSLPTFTSPLQLLWPELSALHYNLIEGQADNWGIMSWHYYFTNSLPKLLVGSAPLLVVGVGAWLLDIVGVKVDGKNRNLAKGYGEVLKTFGAGVVALIGAMSAVGHKEWRFIIYSIPILNLLAAFSASSLWSFPWPKLQPLIRLGLVGLLSINIAATAIMTFLSMNNYPGGEVWKVLEQLPLAREREVTIHFPSYPLQTGSTLFTFLHQSLNATTHLGPFPPFPEQNQPHWTYSKSEDESMSTSEGIWASGVDFVVTEDWTAFGEQWEEVGEVKGLDGVGRGGKFGVEVRWDKKLAVLGRKEEPGQIGR